MTDRPVTTLTCHEVHGVLINALRSAARVYADLQHRCDNLPAVQRLASQFAKQAQEATALADKIEAAFCVNLLGEP